MCDNCNNERRMKQTSGVVELIDQANNNYYYSSSSNNIKLGD